VSADNLFKIAWFLLTAWLVACAFLVQGEYGDGYQTIANARYLFGDASAFFVQRGPLPAIVLWPVEFIAGLAGADPLDVRPHHFLSAALHSLYLAGCWWCLQRVPGSGYARLFAFGAAILTVIFYAYAPYLSHDLLPGLLFVVMIFLAHRWIDKGGSGDAVLLVLLGAAVTLIKQTYALYWVAIVVFALLSFALRWDRARIDLRKLGILLGMATASAVISWLSYALHVGDMATDSAFLSRPLVLISAIATQYGDDMASAFATDLYVRNLPNYGVAAMLLVLPGVVLALRGTDARLRIIAVCWLVSAVALQFIGFREARYLGFLAPLTALLIVPVVDVAFRHRAAAALLVAILAFDQFRGLSLAAGQLGTARTFDVMAFYNATGSEGRVVSSKVLSFAYAAASPLSRDRYHGIYHLTPELIERLNEGTTAVAGISDPRGLGLAGIRTGDRVYYTNNTLVRSPPWNAANEPNGLDQYLLIAGNAIDVRLRAADGGGFVRENNDGSFLVFIPAEAAGPQMPAIAAGRLDAASAQRIYGATAGDGVLDVVAVEIKAICQGRTCSQF
jgi:hypothetical protein